MTSGSAGVVLLIVAAVALAVTLKGPGVFLALVLGAAALAWSRRAHADLEVASLRASLRIALGDVNETLELFNDLRTGMSADAIADRTLHFPALADRGTANPVIQDFHLRADSARRFVARVDAALASDDLDRAQLERLIAVADERALELAASWQDARRAAREIGPG